MLSLTFFNLELLQLLFDVPFPILFVLRILTDTCPTFICYFFYFTSLCSLHVLLLSAISFILPPFVPYIHPLLAFSSLALSFPFSCLRFNQRLLERYDLVIRGRMLHVFHPLLLTYSKKIQVLLWRISTYCHKIYLMTTFSPNSSSYSSYQFLLPTFHFMFYFYVSPSSGEAYSDRQLTLNFEL